MLAPNIAHPDGRLWSMPLMFGYAVALSAVPLVVGLILVRWLSVTPLSRRLSLSLFAVSMTLIYALEFASVTTSRWALWSHPRAFQTVVYGAVAGLIVLALAATGSAARATVSDYI